MTSAATNARHHVAIAADRNFSIPLGITILSLLKHSKNPEQLHIHILGVHIAEDILADIRKICTSYHCPLDYHDVETALANTTTNNFPPVACARFLLPELLDESIQCVLYLDADILVCDDLSELFKLHLDTCLLASAQDIGMLNSRTQSRNIKQLYKKFNITSEGGQLSYFNSGQLIINLTQWRKENIMRRALELACDTQYQFLCIDQDILNILCHGRCITLAPRYFISPGFWRYVLGVKKNAIYSKEELQASYRNPALIHYITSTKPYPLYPPCYGFDRYYKQWRKSPWKKYAPFVPKRIRMPQDIKEKALACSLKGLHFALSHIPHAYPLYWRICECLLRASRMLPLKNKRLLALQGRLQLKEHIANMSQRG